MIALVLVELLLLPQLGRALALSASADLLRPSSADSNFDAWCDRHGIFRVGVQTITTPKSLGGRGLFAVRPMKRGTVVASIPAELVVVASPAAAAEQEEEWQVSLTNKVLELKDENEWIQSWKGSGSLELESLLAEGEEKRLDTFVNAMAGKGRITREGAKQDVKERLDNFNRRLDLLTSTSVSRLDVSKWYTLVMSRSSYLGKEWGYNCGIVPFFDMLNHCHDAGKSNTDLMTFGNCLDKSENHKEKAETSADVLQRKDMLLVLNKDVDEGGELLTQYATDIENEETQLKLWIQYGIPPP